VALLDAWEQATWGLFRCSQTAKTFEEMSTFWKNGSKQGLVKLGCKDLEPWSPKTV
jgi:hypothetical protein